MRLWRIHIRPKGGDAAPAVSWRLCLAQSVLGVGWRVEWPVALERTPEGYLGLGEQAYGDGGWRTNLTRLIKGVQVGDLIWTRDPLARYYLARVTGPWEYRDAQENVHADVVNVRPVDMRQVGLEEKVPGAVVSAFAPRMALQPVNDRASARFSMGLFNEIGEGPRYELEPLHDAIWSYLHSFDVENVVYVYLQAKGYIVFPTRRRPNTMKYEFECAHRDNGHRAVASVKSGDESLAPGEFAQYPCKVFLFAVSQNYPGVKPPNVTTLTCEELVSFMKSSRHILPEAVRTWMDFAGV
jgi:hypothetical protein